MAEFDLFHQDWEILLGSSRPLVIPCYNDKSWKPFSGKRIEKKIPGHGQGSSGKGVSVAGAGQEITIGVRELITFVMRSGDIDNQYRSNQRMMEGIRAHQRIQKAYGEGYQKEVYFLDRTQLEEVHFVVEGRADGLFEKDGSAMIDEIKSTSRPLESLDGEGNPLHWAQAKCYAYFYCKSRKVSQIDVQLTYVNLDEDVSTKKIKKTFLKEELEVFYRDLLFRYLNFSRTLLAWRKERNRSLEGLAFPYKAYRPGQRKLSVGVYQAIEEGKILFVEAPTGIGKTISTLYPALLSLAHLGTDRIYYLTARTTTQREPQKAIELMGQKKVQIKSLTLTAREKICLNERVSCNPIDCPYAKGHFDRVNDAILDLFQKENVLDRETIEKLAKIHQVCPHEFQLDMVNYSDLILCDYNYFFDPQVYLRRSFESESPSSVVLVDEAHNLVDRGREMYSASLSSQTLKKIQEIFEKKDQKGKDEEKERDRQQGKVSRKIARRAEAAKRSLEDFFLEEGGHQKMVSPHDSEELFFSLKALTRAMDPYLSKERGDPFYEEMLQAYFDLHAFLKIEEIRTEGFLTLLEKEEEKLIWKTLCVDPSTLFEEMLSKVRSAVFFSATLSPMNFYVHLLGGEKDPLILHLDSPFPPENLRLYQLSLSTRYRDRSRTLQDLVQAIHLWKEKNQGNGMVYFPSYAYLREAATLYQETYEDPIFAQKPGLDQEERAMVMNQYLEKEGVTGFFVLGGLFAEGIDLPGSALSSAVIVSVGLPGLSFEQNVMKDYFDQKTGRGFDYAYTYPGMNRVLQAAGRVIRKESDQGRVLFIDDRFAREDYRRLMPRHWKNIRYFQSIRQLEEQMRKENHGEK